MRTNDLQEYLAETEFFRFSDPKIAQFITKTVRECTTPTEKAVALYYAVRDGWRYNPYRISFRTSDWLAPRIFDRPDGHCQDKALLLVTFARACGIPARMHLVKVKNHIAVEVLTEKFGTNVLTPHGFAELYLNGKWIKATPAFNQELCARLGVSPLEFDGKTDSVFQEYDPQGGTFMEYLDDYGTFADVPLKFMQHNMEEHYPQLKDMVDEDGVLRIQKKYSNGR